MESLDLSKLDAVENSSNVENVKESHSFKDDRTVDSNLSHDSDAVDPLDAVLESLDTGADGGPSYPSNIHAPQAQTLVYGGYENTSDKWEEYPHQFTSAPGVEAGSTFSFTGPYYQQLARVAEMIGPVDFEESVDYWQQDKWSADNKTHSMWHLKKIGWISWLLQVKLEQGLEMLGIFKKNDSDVSILDDFDFYED